MTHRRLQAYLTGCILLLLGLFLFFRELLVHLPVRWLWASDIDTSLMVWTVSWGFRALFEIHSPSVFFHSNAFFPQLNTLAYSDSLLGLQLFFGPLRLLGVPLLPAFYLTLALLVFLSGMLFVSALIRIEISSPLEIGFIVFGSYFSLAVTNYLIHYQLFGFYVIPPFLLYLYVFLREQKLGDLIVVCGLYVFGVMVAVYLAPMLLVTSFFLAPMVVVSQYREKGLAYFRGLINWKHGLALILFALFLYFVQIRPYLLVSAQPSSDTIERVIIFSALPTAIAQTRSSFSLWYSPDVVVPGSWESAYFPGYFLLLLGLGFLIRTLLRSRNRNTQIHSSGKNDLLTAYLIVFFVVSWILSLGPYLKFEPNSAFSIRLPFYYLAKIVPGLDQVRSPGRFGMFIGLPLSFLGLRFLQSLLAPEGIIRKIGLVVALSILVIESLPVFPLYPYQPDPDGVYKWLSGQIRPGQSVVELPLSTTASQGQDQYVIAMRQLLGSTLHWGRIATGYGAKETREYQDLREADLALQAGNLGAQEILQQSRKYGFEYLLINVPAYLPPANQEWKLLARRCSLVKEYSPIGALLLEISSCH